MHSRRNYVGRYRKDSENFGRYRKDGMFTWWLRGIKSLGGLIESGRKPMREILFRGKRIDTGEWVYGAYMAHDHDGHTIFNQNLEDGTLQGFEVIPETVGQYTGYDDKNGVKVFDGDVLVIDDARFLIRWEEGRGGFRIEYLESDEQYDLSDFWPESEVIGEVIGKAHGNPELDWGD